MVFVTITLTGELTEAKYKAVKEQLPQVVEQLGLEGNMDAKYRYYRPSA